MMMQFDRLDVSRVGTIERQLIYTISGFSSVDDVILFQYKSALRAYGRVRAKRTIERESCEKSYAAVWKAQEVSLQDVG